MNIEIQNRWTGSVIFSLETTSMKLCVEAAIKSAADLRRADLSGANLSAAKGKPPVPPVDNLDGKILEAIEDGGTLEMREWHTCETTHCRAGWAVTISPVGKTLESIIGTSAAAALIYSASYPDLKVPNFFADNETAMEDIKARAALAK